MSDYCKIKELQDEIEAKARESLLEIFKAKDEERLIQFRDDIEAFFDSLRSNDPPWKGANYEEEEKTSDETTMDEPNSRGIK
jgi:hypothetical protein